MRFAKEEPHACLNCGAMLTGPYCALCGQADIDPNLTLRGILGDLIANVLNWDSRFVTSVRQLLLRPGFLTTEYLTGRRARHVPPFRLFLVGSVLYLAVVGITGSHVEIQPGANLPPADSAAVDTSAAGSAAAAEKAPADTTAAVPGGGFANRLKRGARALDRNPETTKRHWFRGFVWSIFLLVPLFAFFLQLAFRKTGVHYPGHLVFAFHMHAFGFLVGAALLLLTFAPDIVVLVGAIALTVFLFAYFVDALRHVYGQGLGRTLLKAATISVVYGFSLLVTVILFTTGLALLAA